MRKSDPFAVEQLQPRLDIQHPQAYKPCVLPLVQSRLQICQLGYNNFVNKVKYQREPDTTILLNFIYIFQVHLTLSILYIRFIILAIKNIRKSLTFVTDVSAKFILCCILYINILYRQFFFYDKCLYLSFIYLYTLCWKIYIGTVLL